MINLNVSAVVTAVKNTTTVEAPFWSINSNRERSNIGQMVHNSLVIVSREEFIASQSGRSIHGVGIIIAATSASRLKEKFSIIRISENSKSKV